MKPNVLLISLFAFVATGCAASKAALPRDVVFTSNEVTEKVRIVEHSQFVPVMVRTQIPDLRELRRSVKDSTDTIENDYAVSTVKINPDGTIDHGLKTKPQTIEDEVLVPVQYQDSTVTRESEAEHSETVTETVEVNVLRWWQRALCWCGVMFVLLILVRVFKTFFTAKSNTVLTVFKSLLNIK